MNKTKWNMAIGCIGFGVFVAASLRLKYGSHIARLEYELEEADKSTQYYIDQFNQLLTAVGTKLDGEELK